MENANQQPAILTAVVALSQLEPVEPTAGAPGKSITSLGLVGGFVDLASNTKTSIW